MKKLVLSALCAVAFAACGGGGDGDGNDVTLQADADVTGAPDAAAAACNPVTQAGCENGEKCAQLVESEDPFLARTACVPDGTITGGGACTVGEAGATGYDDCVAGFDCLNGVCTKICDIGPPDGCRPDPDPGFGEGEYCTLYADLFSDNIGLCVAGCDPNDDAAAAGVVTSTDCGAGNGCYLNSTRGVAACAGTPAPAAELAQNDACYGPPTGGCYLNGCSSGHTALLNNKPQDADGSVCARYCLAANSYSGNDGSKAGAGGNCTIGNLTASGGTGGNNTEHQCRFVQSFYSNTNQVPVEVGMCVPVAPLGGGTWADCSIFDWDGIKAAWNAAAPNGGEAANTAFNNHCLIDPTTPDAPDNVKDICLGIFRGCLSLAEEEAGLDEPAGTPFMSRAAWAKSIGMELPELLNKEQLESL